MVWQSTHPSLLQQIRDPTDQAAWRAFDARYGELIVSYCRGRGLQTSDAEDVRQMVMLSLSNAMTSFVYDPGRGRFRAYLRCVVRNAITAFGKRACRNEHPVDGGLIESMQTDDAEGPDALWDHSWMRHHYRMAMRTLRATCDPKTIDVFDRFVAGDDVACIAEAFSMSEDAVRRVRLRVKTRLRGIIARQVFQEDHLDGPSIQRLAQ